MGKYNKKLVKKKESKSAQVTSVQVKSILKEPKEQVSKKSNDLSPNSVRPETRRLRKLHKPPVVRSKISRVDEQTKLKVVERLNKELNEQMDIRLLLERLERHKSRLNVNKIRMPNASKAMKEELLNDIKKLSTRKSINTVVPDVSHSIDHDNTITTTKGSFIFPVSKHVPLSSLVTKNKPTKIPALALGKEPELISQARYSRMFSSSFYYCPKINQRLDRDATYAKPAEDVEHTTDQNDKCLTAQSTSTIKADTPFLLFGSLKSLPFSKGAKKKFDRENLKLKEQATKPSQEDH